MILRKKVDIPIYHGLLIIIFTDDFDAVIKKHKIPMDQDRHYNAFVWGTRSKKGLGKYLMVFNIQPTHTTMGHEVTHAVNWLFLDRGIEIDLKNDEPQAYMAGWITQQIYKAAKKLKVKIITNMD